MTRKPSSGTAIALALALSLSAAACTRVVETGGLAVPATGYAPTCRSTLGAYYLPRALLKLNVTAGPTTISTAGLNASTTMVADRAQAFCLDYLAQPNSEDVVTARRDEHGLLSVVTSSVTDKTPDIAKSVAAIAENIAIQNGRDAAAGEPVDTLDLEFDPFVWRELDLANKALRRFGFCVYVEGHSFAASNGASPAQAVSEAERWCEKPWPYHPRSDELARLPVPPETMRTGILYRPNAARKIVVMRKTDPGRRGARHWTLYQTRRVEMPNASPVLVIGVDRAAFANRKTTLKFNGGVLTDVTVDKKSELAGFVSIPLVVAQAIVDVPTQIVQVRIADTDNQIALLNAQSQLLDAIANYKKNGPEGARSARLGDGRSAVASNPDYRSGLMIQGCRDAGGRDECDKLRVQPR